MPKTIICSFSVGLDELPVKQRTVPGILAFLKQAGHFSVFEATSKPQIARILDNLFKRELIAQTGGEFPWTNVALTEAGERALAADTK